MILLAAFTANFALHHSITRPLHHLSFRLPFGPERPKIERL